MIELIDMGSSELLSNKLRRVGFNSFDEATASAYRLIEIESLSQDHAAIKRSGCRLIVVLSGLPKPKLPFRRACLASPL